MCESAAEEDTYIINRKEPSAGNQFKKHIPNGAGDVRYQYKKAHPLSWMCFFGAADGSRTRTVSLPGDFKSPVSTDSTTATRPLYFSTGKPLRQGIAFRAFFLVRRTDRGRRRQGGFCRKRMESGEKNEITLCNSCKEKLRFAKGTTTNIQKNAKNDN